MKQIVFFILTFALYPLLCFGEDEYVTVDPTQLESVSGKTLLIVSYATVLGMLVSYWIYMTIQSCKVNARISSLTQTEQNGKKQ
jgi:hypothetical protein